MDQLEKSSNENVVLLQKVENLEMTNRNLQVEIEQQDIRKFIISNDARCKFYVRCSDKFIVEDSGYIENLKEGDHVLSTDRGGKSNWKIKTVLFSS